MYVEHPITGLAIHKFFMFDFMNGKYPSWFKPLQTEGACMLIHWHMDMELLYIREGEFSITVNSVNRKVTTGDLVIVNPNDSHSGTLSSLQEKASYDVLKISPEKLLEFGFSELNQNLIDEKMKFYNFIPSETVKKLALDLFIETIITSTEYEDESYRMAALGSIYMMFSALMHHGLVQRNAEAINYIRKRNTFVSDMLNYFDRNWNKPVTSKDAAAEFSYSHIYFCKIFHRNMGRTFSRFLIKLKLDKAAEYLDSGIKAGQVMEMIGMNNYSYFYRSFKQYYGISPERFKKSSETQVL